jgi:HPt (histidine-containing phosphotransfer) domain-containing protein
MSNSGYTYINLEYLYEVADNDTDFVREIITDYLNNVPEQLAQMENVAAAGDIEAVKFIAHKMKSSFQFMGVQQLIELSQQMEHAPEENRLDVFKNNSRLMKPIVESVLKELTHKLETL